MLNNEGTLHLSILSLEQLGCNTIYVLHPNCYSFAIVLCISVKYKQYVKEFGIAGLSRSLIRFDRSRHNLDHLQKLAPNHPPSAPIATVAATRLDRAAIPAPVGP
jgi:hypothetical protein